MAKRYDRMTSIEQRAVDEIDVEILNMRAAGASYVEIQRALSVSPARIAKIVKECAE